MTRVTAYAFSFKALKSGDIRLSDYVGKPILVVNTASLCGYTPQYSGLQALWTRYRDKGLMIVAVPSNDFGGQEPGGEAEIGHTAHQYGVSFPSRRQSVDQELAAASLLQVGGGRAPARHAALEFSQISGRPRRPYRGGVCDRRRAHRLRA